MSRLKSIVDAPSQLYYGWISQVPGAVGHRLRYHYWKPRLKHLGAGVTIDCGVMIHGAEHVSIGDNTWIDRNVTLIAGPAGTERVTQRKPNPDYPGLEGELSIGANTHLSIGVVVCAIGGVHIGACSGIASYSAIYSFSHHYRNGTDRDDRRQFSFTPRVRPDQQSMVLGPVFIGDHTAVGLQATILPGSSLRTGAWVASGVVFQGVAAEQQVISASAPVQAKPIDHLHILR